MSADARSIFSLPFNFVAPPLTGVFFAGVFFLFVVDRLGVFALGVFAFFGVDAFFVFLGVFADFFGAGDFPLFPAAPLVFDLALFSQVAAFLPSPFWQLATCSFFSLGLILWTQPYCSNVSQWVRGLGTRRVAEAAQGSCERLDVRPRRRREKDR